MRVRSYLFRLVYGKIRPKSYYGLPCSPHFLGSLINDQCLSLILPTECDGSSEWFAQVLCPSVRMSVWLTVFFHNILTPIAPLSTSVTCASTYWVQYLRCNFPFTLSVRMSASQSACHNFLKWREVKLPCSCRSTFYLTLRALQTLNSWSQRPRPRGTKASSRGRGRLNISEVSWMSLFSSSDFPPWMPSISINYFSLPKVILKVQLNS